MEVVLIVETIVKHLDLKDLLQVRLLNTLWNESAKLQIKKHYFPLKDDGKLKKLSELLTNANSSYFPFRKLEIPITGTNLNDLKDLIKKFGKLFLGYRFGTRITRKRFDNRIPGEAHRNPVCDTIADILSNSPNIASLELNTSLCNWDLTRTNQNFLFTKLTSITLEACSGNDIKFLKQMLDASPSLKYLIITESSIELSYIISVIGTRNISVLLKQIHGGTIQENSSFNSKNFPIYLTQVNVYRDKPNLSKLTELFQHYSHTIKHLKIDGDYFNLVHIPTMKYLKKLKLSHHGRIDNFQDNFYQGQFPSLKRLKIELYACSSGLNFFIDPKLPLQNLKKLVLQFFTREDDGILPPSINLPVDLPLLQTLNFLTNTEDTIKIGKTENVRKLFIQNEFTFKDLHLRFPNLKILSLNLKESSPIESGYESLHLIFQNFPRLEELRLISYYDFPISFGNNICKIITGLPIGDKEFVNQAISIMMSNNSSLAQDLLKDSKPNFGNLPVLRSLTIARGNLIHGTIAIAFMIFSGKLQYLRKLEISLEPMCKMVLDLCIGRIFSTNNTKFISLDTSVNILPFYHKDLTNIYNSTQD